MWLLWQTVVVALGLNSFPTTYVFCHFLELVFEKSWIFCGTFRFFSKLFGTFCPYWSSLLVLLILGNRFRLQCDVHMGCNLKQFSKLNKTCDVLANSCQLWKLSVPTLFLPFLCFCLFVEINFGKFWTLPGMFRFFVSFSGASRPYCSSLLDFLIQWNRSCLHYEAHWKLQPEIFSKKRIKHVTALENNCGRFRFEWFSDHLRACVFF